MRTLADDPVLVVMPADHVIDNVDAFQDVVGHAARYAQDSALHSGRHGG